MKAVDWLTETPQYGRHTLTSVEDRLFVVVIALRLMSGLLLRSAGTCGRAETSFDVDFGDDVDGEDIVATAVAELLVLGDASVVLLVVVDEDEVLDDLVVLVQPRLTDGCSNKLWCNVEYRCGYSSEACIIGDVGE